MATRNIVPRNDGEGGIGTSLKKWLYGFFKILKVNRYIEFTNSSSPGYQEKLLFYDNNSKTLGFYNDIDCGSPLGVNRDIFLRVYNESGSTISRGKAVYITGSNTINVPTIELAKADVEGTSFGIGLTLCDIPDSSYGYVLLTGLLLNVNTSSFNPGDNLYVSSLVAGELTNVKPSIAVVVGKCVKSDATNGIIFVASKELGAVGADMLKSVYDTNDNGAVDKSESTKIIYASDETETLTTSVSFVTKLSHSINMTQGKKYLLTWGFALGNSIANRGSYYQILIDGNIIDNGLVAESIDNYYVNLSGIYMFEPTTTGSYTVEIQFANAQTQGTAAIRRVRVVCQEVYT